MAPILPHLAEEIHDRLDLQTADDSEKRSFFTQKWVALVSISVMYIPAMYAIDCVGIQDPEWHDPEAEEEMDVLLTLRKEVNQLLEQARRDKCVAYLPSPSPFHSENLIQLPWFIDELVVR